MNKLFFSPYDNLMKKLIFFIIIVFIFVSISTLLLSKENSIQLVTSTGRAVIIENDVIKAKKRALDDALYLATLQGGAKVDGYSTVDSNTNLKENLIIRPSSDIIDFKILEEKQDKTHYVITIQAALLVNELNVSCSERKKLNLTIFKTHYSVSSKTPAWSNEIPLKFSEILIKNFISLNDINIKNSSDYYINPSKESNISKTLDYESLTETKVSIKNGEFSLIPKMMINFEQSRIHRFSRELSFDIKLEIYEGPNYNYITDINYNFSLDLGPKTGYPHIDSFYRVSRDKLNELISISLSKLHYRILDNLKCVPLEARIIINDGKLIAPIGTNQGLYSGKIGIVSEFPENKSMQNWYVVSVKTSNSDFSILESLNPEIDLSLLNGKKIRFID